MTATLTGREIRSKVNGNVPKVDSPAVSPRARARVPVTQRAGNIVVAATGIWSSAVRAGARWWAWTARPMSLRASWRASAVDPRRVPLRHAWLLRAWRVSNATDRIVMFALVLAAPTVFTGPLRWLAARPTRRFGFYLVVTAFAVYVLVGHRAGKG